MCAQGTTNSCNLQKKNKFQPKNNNLTILRVPPRRGEKDISIILTVEDVLVLIRYLPKKEKKNDRCCHVQRKLMLVRDTQKIDSNQVKQNRQKDMCSK